MLKKIALVLLVSLAPLSISNGYYKTVTIDIEGLNGTCYGTLLSDKTVSGSWSTTIKPKMYAPDNVILAFDEYHDEKDNYFYLNFFQDVSDGLLYWPYLPPTNFKLLLYFPDTDTFIASDIYNIYALHSTFIANVNDQGVSLVRNFNYLKLVNITAIRTLVGIVLSLFISLLYGRPIRTDRKYYIISNILFHIILNILISFYSFENGFSIVEYYGIMWLPYLIWFILFGYIIVNKTHSLRSGYMCSLYTNLLCYTVGLFMADLFPKLFTV